MDNLVVKTGIKTRLIGIVLVFLGILDTMLSWRGGFAASQWYVILIALGLFVYAVGAIRGARAPVAARDLIRGGANLTLSPGCGQDRAQASISKTPLDSKTYERF
jgi:hypothetical protein